MGEGQGSKKGAFISKMFNLVDLFFFLEGGGGGEGGKRGRGNILHK